VDDRDDFAEPPAHPRDSAVDQAMVRLRQHFDAAPKRVFYSRQIETALEREFFHWISSKALAEMSAAGEIQRIPEQVGAQGNPVNFFANRKHRYVRREIASVSAILTRIFHPDFARAVGSHCELMFDAAFARHGFRVEALHTNEWKGAVWTATNHNLDRIVTRDGLDYGVEIKNTQTYIERDELLTKLSLCQHLAVTPLFLMRFSPKTYNYLIYRRQGFALLFEHQLYPFGYESLAAEVRDKLGLKVHSPRDVPASHIERFIKWHERRAGGSR
jgi:hypothetical protein